MLEYRRTNKGVFARASQASCDPPVLLVGYKIALDAKQIRKKEGDKDRNNDRQIKVDKKTGKNEERLRDTKTF